MQLRRKASETTGRRVNKQPNERLPSGSVLSYRSRRSEEAFNIGRQATRPIPGQKLPAGVRFWLQRSGLLILTLALAVSVFNILSLSTSTNVVSAVSGKKLSAASRSRYEQAANQLMAASFWNRNKLTVNTANLSTQLLNKFPELASADISVPLIAQHLVIYVEPTQPVMIVMTSNGAFSIDQRGRALAKSSSPQSLNLPDIPVLQDQSGLRLELGKPALTPQDVAFMQTVDGELAAKGFLVTTLTLPAASREVDATIAGQPYFVKFNLQNNDARQQAGTFLATIKQLKSQNITPAKYVDVRVDGRAYYL